MSFFSRMRNRISYLPLSGAVAFGTLSAGAQQPLAVHNVDDKEEAFLIRRIAEFWKDQDYAIVKSEITTFLEVYPKSKLGDQLRGILGDLYLQEGAYGQALTCYTQVKSADVLEKICLNKLQCYYELNRFSDIVKDGSSLLRSNAEEVTAREDELYFLLAEAYFRMGSMMEDREKKEAYLKSAEPFYEKILNTSFNDPTMFALAEIYRQCKQNEKASQFFRDLAERHPDQKEELLFHAALAQADYDRKAAIDTFTTIIDQKGLKTKEASLNRVILYFQEERFQNVLEAYSKIYNQVDAKEQTFLDYIVGRSHFALQEHEKASFFLSKYIRVTYEDTPELRNALLMQLNCAQNLKNESLYKETIGRLQSTFPKDSELAQALFIHAMMLKDLGDYVAAEKKLEELLKNPTKFEETETLYLEYGLITYNNEKWDKSHATLASFLKQFPKSGQAPVAWKYFLSTSFNLLKELEKGRDVGYSKENFFTDLSNVLAEDAVLTGSERKECLFLQAKMAYDLNKYKEALPLLNTYLEAYPEDAATPETHLLVALCHHKLQNSPELFCHHAEAALKGDPNLQNIASIHLELYNVYLSLIEKEQKNKKGGDTDLKPLFDKAADHLFASSNHEELPIKLENRLWLANYYYDKIFEYPKPFQTDGLLPERAQEAYFSRCALLFENILVKDTAYHLITLDNEHAFLEWEVLKLANILGRQGFLDKKIALLQGLIETQNKHPTWKWQVQREALFELAKTYELRGDKESALDTFSFLRDQKQKTASFLGEYAGLHTLRLSFEELSDSDKHGLNKDVLKVLSSLKEYQIRKSPSSEPIHLEAACEYAFIRAQIVKDEDAPEKYLFFLNRIKEDYENTSDPMIASYQKGLAADAEKRALFQEYMAFLEAEMLRTNAILASKSGHAAQSVEMEEKARKILAQIQEKSPTFYLKMRAGKSLAALGKTTLVYTKAATKNETLNKI
jgi:TolA-binding protein